eukprot:TRINITY_DN9199_c0_g1_i1.p1 TRINITY_DN9199_c0_g1~~TRINITY_DN9199_c0_g1_i1.p1  ORF type:complete len:307 (+),score=56.04 TRINITY_DN9199_c0_g1_i1:60-980(+)
MTTSGLPSKGTLLNLVGNTPLCDLSEWIGKPNVKVYAKLEGNNPAGSVKDRAARSMIVRAFERGDLKKGMRLIEATSGNTGIALAMIAQAMGIEMHLAMPENSTLERTQTMRAYGAIVHLIPGSIEAARDWAEKQVEITEGQPDAFFMLNQFANPDNPRGHYESTGPEVWSATDGKVTHFISAMGTTGTIMGTGKYLKEKNPDVQIVGCSPAEGSQIPGIRRWPEAYLPKFFQRDLVDRIVDIEQSNAEETARRMGREVGLLAGPSSGGACWAASKIAQEVDEGVIVFICCDRGDRYLSSGLFSEK